ncbi:Type III Secretion system apparatus protein ssaK [Candidatus Glomeribacter gigasporarum BEG34]|uniref:Type III Secretion system apparatus protein ssaK n=1 Tax=Candidatus Glomeribacter gigasporarum BEG34 TaxID=1070319 RepID=G2J8Y7_9BURK|nr:FliH/SctL family protein [Candidatus Glomeribacter gigasporarum]CCD29234.1 Type III Secretion system apparatus protein ssaK [Candidatus Glomeribacter gigasporarum BEG34]
MRAEENPFNVPVESLNGLSTSEAILHADVCSLLERAQAVLGRAQTQAQTILCEAHEEAMQIRAEAAHLGETEKEALIRQTRDEWVQQGLQWLVEEARFESALVDRMEARVRHLLTAVLREWIDHQDRLEQLAHWLTVQVRDRAQPLPSRIRLHPDDRDALAARLAQEGLPEAIDYSADPALAQGQAILEMEFLRIEFDLARHWEQVLSALKGSSVPI